MFWKDQTAYLIFLYIVYLQLYLVLLHSIPENVINKFTGVHFNDPVLRIRSIFFRIRIRIRGSGFENTDPDPDPDPT